MESECEMCGWKDSLGTWHDLCFTCVGKLKAENAKQREALISISKMLDGYGVDHARSIARAVLGEQRDQCTCVKDKEITCIVHPTTRALHEYISELQVESVRLREAIKKMVEAWDNNDRSEYQTIIQQMEECCEQRFSARDI